MRLPTSHRPSAAPRNRPNPPRRAAAISLSRFPKDWLTVPNTGLAVFVLTFVVPTVASTAICYSVASTEKR